MWLLGALLLGAAIVGVFFVLPNSIGKSRNFVRGGGAHPALAPLHAKLLVADLHADSLLWDRDLLERGEWGHVDLPRLLEGNVALQTFSAVTQSPRRFSLEGNRPYPDAIAQLVVVQRWPLRTWRSPLERALYQARKLEDLAARSGGRLTLVRTRAELAQYLERRAREPRLTAGWLSIEGAHALEGDLANLEKVYQAGYRMIAPSHFFDSAIGGSSTGVSRVGLTPLGERWVREMEQRKMIVDLAHASERTIDDVLALATRPVIVSHTGVRATCNNDRNLSDKALRAVARNGGVVGIGFWQFATCGETIAAIVRAIRHTVRVMGIDHVALGSDFDGSVVTPIDASQLGQLTAALLADGFSEADTAKIMGGNVVRLLLELLP